MIRRPPVKGIQIACPRCHKSTSQFPSNIKRGRRFCSHRCGEIASTTPLPVRFWSHATKTESCWNWNGAVYGNGYGKFGFSNTKTMSAHRVAWMLTYGHIPKRQCVLHRCDNRRCVNPSHLFLGSRRDNTQDALQKNRLAFGERIKTSKLTTLQVQEIRSRLDGHYGEYSHLGREYHVSPETVSLIAKNKIWKQALAQGVCQVSVEVADASR